MIVRAPLHWLAAQLPTVLWLTTMWVLLWGDLAIGTIIAGAVVASLCYAAARLPVIPVRLRFRPLRVLRLASAIGLDLLTSSVRVAFHVLWRPRQVRGAIVEVPMRTDSDFLLAMTSSALSLVTGSVVIELNRSEGVVYVHGLPIESERAVARLRRQARTTEELFAHAFGTSEDIAKFEHEAEGTDRKEER
ncbi:MAG: Na+/H+ antiporter subunit E [Nocardiopsaceae bacterium]|nr:Na+/H+ antiporter subunit E [Nocardiopsaceae bacterium]